MELAIICYGHPPTRTLAVMSPFLHLTNDMMKSGFSSLVLCGDGYNLNV